MKVKSTQALRYFIKTQKGGDFDRRTDSDFLGSYYGSPAKGIKGFFKIYHGIKEDISIYLQSILKIAEDGQAVYEFIQNAVDCNSSQFWIFYNDNYFLAINNGESFKPNEIASILNIAQSDKRNLDDEERCDKIGRFGIGFKLVHRLVGENDGSNELTKINNGELKGPVLFSWSHYSQLKSFMDSSDVFEQVKFNKDIPEEYHKSPWLFKILLTNFPASPGEVVKDFDYKPFTPLPISEINEFKDYLKSSLGETLNNGTLLSKGSMFFIKLGKGKAERLRKEAVQLEAGVNYSMHFFNKLQKITINDIAITKKPMEWLSYEIKKNEKEFIDIDPEYSFCPIKISVGFTKENKRILLIKDQPNFYKYFPLGDETNKLGLILHSDAFDIESNRRKLHNSTRNEKLINAITNRVIETLDSAINSTDEKYKYMFLSILLSEANQSEINANTLSFITPLKDFIKCNVVTNSGTAKSEHVKIKSFKYPIELKDIGFDNYQWFAWNDISFKEACDSANSELGIEKWGIRHLLSNSDSQKVATYLKSLKLVEYIKFIEELKSEDLIKSLRDKLIEAKWLLTQKGSLVNIQKIIDGEVFLIKDISTEGALIFQNITKDVICPELNFAHSYIADITSPLETSNKTISDFLCQSETGLLISSLTFKERTYLNGLVNKDEEPITFLPLFKSKKQGGSLKPLNSLISNTCEGLPTWLNDFVIDAVEENALGATFQAQLLKEKDLLEKLFCNLESYNEIITNINSDKLEEFYDYILKLHKNKPEETKIDYTAIPWVYVESTAQFALASSVYWPDSFSKLSDTNKYSSIKSVIETISDEKLPHFSALKIKSNLALGGKEFNLSIITPTEKAFDLNVINDFLDWAEANGDKDLLNHLLFTKVDDKFSMGKVTGTLCYYTADVSLITFIQVSAINTKLSLFPKELYTKERYKIGLLEGVLLLKDLLENGLSTLAIAKYIQGANDTLLSLHYLEMLTELNIESSKSYTIGDAEFKILKLVSNQIIDDAEKVDSFREKIILDGIKLLEKAVSADVRMFDADNKFIYQFQGMEISDILPAYKGKTYPVSEIIELFVDFRDTESLRKVFKAKGKSTKKIFNELLDLKLDSYNAAQTLFLSYYQSLYPDEKVLDGKIFFSTVQDAGKEEYVKELHRFLDYCLKESNYTEFVNQKIITGFNPDLLLAVDDYALETEKLPGWLKAWVESKANDEVQEFISKMGIKNESSPVVQLRMGLLGDATVNMDAARGGITEPDLLVNTFDWLLTKHNDRNYAASVLKPLYERALALNISIKTLPLPLPTDITCKTYQLYKTEENDQYHLIWELWGNHKSDVWNHLNKVGKIVIDELLPGTFLDELNPIKLSVTSELDTENVLQNLRDCNLSFYKFWPEKDSYIIKIFKGSRLPRKITYNDEIVNSFYEGIYEKLNDFHIVAESIENALPHSIRDHIPDFFDRLNSWKSDFENNRTERKLSPEEEEAIMKLFDGVVPEEFRKNLNLAALASALVHLDGEGYDFFQANKQLIDTLEYAQLTPVYKDGVQYTVMCRSARLGLLYLTKKAWDRLDNQYDPNVMLFADKGYGEFELFRSKQEVLDVNSDNPTDFQVMRIESRANASELDEMLQGKFEDASRLWIIFRLKGNEHFDKLFFERPETNNNPMNSIQARTDDTDGY